ncbi:MAG: hypothetical protein KJO11_12030 [Gemmatimonadetes bacterium]|nr:hypothetical protein [Gemmatimonadota bacterium]
MRSTPILALAAALCCAPFGATPLSGQESVPTRVVVRAVSNDAKIIGSGVGGARVMIRDAVTGQILASGVQSGSTGDTGAIMGERARGAPVFDSEGAGAFEATLDLTAPTQVVIEAEGPLGAEHALQRASTTLLLVPGHDVVGNGVVLTLHGFTVEVVDAPASGRPGHALDLVARVTMLCGCPTEPGGMWDADRYSLEVALVQGERVVATAPLTWSGERSVYDGSVVVPDGTRPGDYALRIVAVDSERANAGMVLHPVRVGG